MTDIVTDAQDKSILKNGQAEKSMANTLASDDLPSNMNSFMDGQNKNVSNLSGSALQQLSEILKQHMRIDQLGDMKGNCPTIPINDLRGHDAGNYSREERHLRCTLASLYRLVDLHGWTQSIYNHISARSTENKDNFLINPFGLLYHEIQASSLVKIDPEGKIMDSGSSILGINKAGWTLHSALHTARDDVNCIVHVHLPDVIAVSCIKAGLLPISPEASELISHAGITYHDYQGILVDENEKKSLQEDLGATAKVMFLRNHGVVVAAKNIPEAWFLLKRVVSACQTQMRLLQLGGGSALLAKLKCQASSDMANMNGGLNGSLKRAGSRPFDHLVSQAPPANTNTSSGNQSSTNGLPHTATNGATDAEACSDEPHAANGHSDTLATVKSQMPDETEWDPVEQEFEAQMRVLDSAGFRSGHRYRQPNLLRRGAGAQNTSAGHAMTTMSRMGTGLPLDSTALSTHAPGGDPMLMSQTDWSEELHSQADDVDKATHAGQLQRAKIAENVKVNKQKSSQQQQYLRNHQSLPKTNGATHGGGVSLGASQSFHATDRHLTASSPKHPQQQQPMTPEQLVAGGQHHNGRMIEGEFHNSTPLKQPQSTRTPPQRSATAVTADSQRSSRVDQQQHGRGTVPTPALLVQSNGFNDKTATLPANTQPPKVVVDGSRSSKTLQVKDDPGSATEEDESQHSKKKSKAHSFRGIFKKKEKEPHHAN